MKKIIQMIPAGIMIVPMSLNAQDTKTIIGLLFLIASRLDSVGLKSEKILPGFENPAG